MIDRLWTSCQRRRVHLCVVTVTLATCLASFQAAAAQGPDTRVAGVRSANPEIADAVRSGRRLSRTFAVLTEQITSHGGIVLVEEGRCRSGSRACLMHFVTPAGRYRYLFIKVELARVRTSLIAIVGHELMHALEVLRDIHVDTASDVYYLFDRLGWSVRPWTFETAAARDVERRIEGDLLTAPLDPNTPMVRARPVR